MNSNEILEFIRENNMLIDEKALRYLEAHPNPFPLLALWKRRGIKHLFFREIFLGGPIDN